MKAKTILLILTILFTGQFLSAQGWELNIKVLPIHDHGSKILIADNGDYLINGWSYFLEDNPVTFLTRVSPEGNEIWTQTYYNTDPDSLDYWPAGIAKASDEGYILAGTTFDENPHKLLIFKVDESGDTLWSKKNVLPFSTNSNFAMRSITNTSDGGYAIIGASESQDQSILVKIDDEANVDWMEVFEIGLMDTGAFAVIETSDGNFVIAGRTQDVFPANRRTFIQKRDQSGLVLWTNDFEAIGSNLYQRTGLKETIDNGLIIAAGNNIYKTDSDGILEWEKSYPLVQIEAVDQSIDGGYIFTGEFPITKDLFILKTDSSGDFLWNKLFGGSERDIGFDIIQDVDGSIIATGSIGFEIGSSDLGDLFIIKTNSSGNLYDNVVKGRVYRDEDQNCEDDSGEPGMNMNMVQVSGSDTLYTFTNENGEYEIGLDTGSYEIRSILPNLYWGTCIDVPYLFEISNVPDTVTIDLPSQVLITCPYLEVDLGAPFLRRCFESAYHVNYCNSGTAIAEDAEVTVILDPYLDYVTSSIGLASQNGDTLVFEVGDIDIDECGSFSIIVYVDCDWTVIGQTHCVTALITPDSICIDLDSLWDGSSLEVDALCTGDSIFFFIENTGTGDMQTPRNYIVTEDVIMYDEGSVQLLSGEEVQVFAMEANGATWRLEVEQAEGHPGNSQPSVVVEGCIPFGNPFNLYFVNTFSQDDGNPFVSIDCRENIGAFDPNDKYGFPTGWEEEHFIERNEDIEYLIRFQNTGTDTAFTVVVADPISPHLDITTLRPGASSHPYQLSFDASNQLIFTFDNIMLPDSNVNEAASHGFVKFKIGQKENLPLGTVIYNNASILFDFNEAVITNETFHTIAAPLLTVAIEDPVLANTSIIAYPNPFIESTTIEVVGVDFKELSLHLFDINGRLMSSFKAEDHRFSLKRNGLSAGMYFYRIEGDGQLVGVGKLIVH